MIISLENLPSYMDVKPKEEYIKLLDSFKKGDEFIAVSLTNGIEKVYQLDYEPLKAIFIEKSITYSAGAVYEFKKQMANCKTVA